MRLFIAVDLPETLKDHLVKFKTDISGASWSRRESYHLTLRFLGDDIPETRVPELESALNTIQLPAFELTLQGVGRFPPNEKKAARVLWIGIAPNPPLTKLYQAVEKTVTASGFPADDHTPYHPHITLARLKSFQPDPAVDTFLKQHADFRADPFRVEALHLYSSTLTPQGAEYKRLISVQLSKTDTE